MQTGVCGRRAAESLGKVGAGNEAVVNVSAGSPARYRPGCAERCGREPGKGGSAGNEVVVSALLEALHDADQYVRRRAAESLGKVGVGNEAVVNALLEALHDADRECAVDRRQRAWARWEWATRRW